MIWVRDTGVKDTDEDEVPDDEWVVFVADDEELYGKRLSDFIPADIASAITKEIANNPVTAFFLQQNEAGMWEKHEVKIDETELDNLDTFPW